MSRVSFVNNPNPTASETEAPYPEGVVGNIGPVGVSGSRGLDDSSAVARYESPIAFDDSNIGMDDIILPRINLVQKVGELSNIFNPGEIVLNQSLVIHEPATPEKQKPGTGLLLFTVLGFKKTVFAEKVDGGVTGLLLNQEGAVVAKNGTLDYDEWKESVKAAKEPGGPPAKRYFQRLATAAIMIEKPAFLEDPDHISFPYDCEGKYYALALWAMKSTAYTRGAKMMFTARKIGHLKQGYPAQGWSLTTKLEKFGDNFAYVPIVRPGAKSTDGFIAFVREVIGLGR